jgi:release factor glutamine methyltransferase
LDVGVGSGAIACSIAAEVPNAVVDATDVSQSARAMAERNALEMGVAGRVRTYFGAVANPVAHRWYDVVVANLPYVPTRNLPRPPAAAGFEPRGALDGGADGLDAYRQLLPQLPRLVAPGGLALLEAAPPTIRRLAELTRAHWADAAVEIRADYSGRDRYLRCFRRGPGQGSPE